MDELQEVLDAMIEQADDLIIARKSDDESMLDTDDIVHQLAERALEFVTLIKSQAIDYDGSQAVLVKTENGVKLAKISVKKEIKKPESKSIH